jgi:hypothetical protein
MKIEKAPIAPASKNVSVFAKWRFMGAANEYLTICKRFRQRAEQVLASRRPLKELLQIKHFLEAIFVFSFVLAFYFN